MWLIPTNKQWKSWSLPSKLTAISVLLGIIPLGLYGIDKLPDLCALVFSSTEDQIAISPRSMDFSASIGKDSQKQIAFSNKYTLSVVNQSNGVLYGIWIELKPVSLSYQNIAIEPVTVEDMHCLPGLPTKRADTYGLIMKDEKGNITLMTAIQKLQPKQVQDYEISLRNNVTASTDSALKASILKASTKQEPTRFQEDKGSLEFMFPNRLPKSGSIIGILLFPLGY